MVNNNFYSESIEMSRGTLGTTRANFLEIQTIDRPINAEITIPTSKSLTHRSLIIASLAKGTSKITNPLIAEDTLLTLQALQAMNVPITKLHSDFLIEGTAGKLQAPCSPLFLENSGTSLRLLTTIASLIPNPTILTGNKDLKERPIHDLLKGLQQLGVKSEFLGEKGKLPIKICSQLHGGITRMRGDISSQFISSLLISAPYAKKDITIIPTTPLKSEPYIRLTIEIMKEFGIMVKRTNNRFQVKAGQRYSAKDYSVEGDFSSASYFLAAAAILGGVIRISNLNWESQQADRVILEYLERMGCTIQQNNNDIQVERDPDEPLEGLSVDMHNCPDIVPTIAIIACFASSPTIIRNIAHLKFKETDRLAAITTELEKLGVNVQSTDDSLKIFPLKKIPSKVLIETYNDHRIAMSFAIAGLKIPGITIKNPTCVKKSFPNFFEVLLQLYP
ncbi:MAG: 3-phosphoshikimate 1-carboxyvinyltransferase [Candidatus Heimdallarchaeota archaeon]|nr:3-phosphoshikimate 1-carboxyvinyltransferase [Candidatus Heimdallarchaeota archaeon]